MPTPKTDADKLTAEIKRFKKRLEKINLTHLEISGVVIKPSGHSKKCGDDEEARMIQQPDGSFRLKCVKKV